MCGQTFGYVTRENQIPQLRGSRGIVRYANLAPERGRPPPGGEEAEVVVYQPRGVGLMHTRHKPSDAHYTHGGREGRKYYLPPKAVKSRKDYSHPHVS
jgi:hypothetical protein